MVKCEATIDVSFDPKYDVLPRHVFQTHTNGPAIAPIGEIRELPIRDVHCTGAYLHTSPAALGIEHRAVPSITKPRGHGADLANFYGPLAEEKNAARLPLSNVGPRIGPLEAENEAVPLILASELTATDYSGRGEFKAFNHHGIVVGVIRSSPGPSEVAAHVAAGPPAVHGGRGRTVHGGRGRSEERRVGEECRW